MHEVAFAINLLEQILAAAEANAMTSIQSARVEAGMLQQIVPEALQTAFDAAAEGSLAAGIALEIIELPAVARCDGCNREFEPALADYRCPECHQANTRILSGREVILASVEGEINEESSEA